MGIDVGFSERKPTTCLCLLNWDLESATFTFQSTGSDCNERAQAINALVGHLELEAVALDGPLTHGLQLVRHYRSAEAILSRGALQKRGKPGQTCSPLGQKLHEHATKLANLVLTFTTVAPATHYEPIHESRLLEAFPNMFLAAIVPERDLSS